MARTNATLHSSASSRPLCFNTKLVLLVAAVGVVYRRPASWWLFYRVRADYKCPESTHGSWTASWSFLGNVLRVAQEARGWVTFASTIIWHRLIDVVALSVEVILEWCNDTCSWLRDNNDPRRCEANVISQMMPRHIMRLHTGAGTDNCTVKLRLSSKHATASLIYFIQLPTRDKPMHSFVVPLRVWRLST